MTLLACLFTYSSEPNQSQSSSREDDGRLAERNDMLVDGWLKVDIWKCYQGNDSSASLPHPEIFEIDEDGEHPIIFSEVSEEKSQDANDKIEASSFNPQTETANIGEGMIFNPTAGNDLPRLTIPAFPERLSLDMFVDAVTNLELSLSSSITSIDNEEQHQEIERGKSQRPLGTDIFASIVTTGKGQRRWSSRSDDCNINEKSRKPSAGRFSSRRRTLGWIW